MKTKPHSNRLDVPKIMTQLEEYEKSPARGGTRIAIPVEQAVKVLAKHKPDSGRRLLTNDRKSSGN
jgi:hypothetical protein